MTSISLELLKNSLCNSDLFCFITNNKVDPFKNKIFIEYEKLILSYFFITKKCFPNNFYIWKEVSNAGTSEVGPSFVSGFVL